MATWYSDRGTMGETMALIRVRSPARGFLVVNKAIFGVSAKGIKTSLFWRLLIMINRLVCSRVRASYTGHGLGMVIWLKMVIVGIAQGLSMRCYVLLDRLLATMVHRVYRLVLMGSLCIWIWL